MDRYQIDRRTIWKVIAIIFIVLFSLSSIFIFLYISETSIIDDEKKECERLLQEQIDYTYYAEKWVDYANELENNTLDAFIRCERYFCSLEDIDCDDDEVINLMVKELCYNIIMG